MKESALGESLLSDKEDKPPSGSAQPQVQRPVESATTTAPNTTTGAPAVPSVRIKGLSKTFRREGGALVRAVNDIGLEVMPGEFLVLLGPSGCGKTTLLRMIAGLETPDRGEITLNGATVFDSAKKIDFAPENRSASMVFQSYALWPHMTVFENVAYPLRSQRVPRTKVRSRVQEVLDIVGIGQLGKQYPNQLSGGQQQRVALARAVVASQHIILFDEPLSNIDAKVRDKLRLEIVRMQRELGFTAIYVTHDQEEAMTLGTRIAVLDEGIVAQLDTPREVYENPTSAYVAAFVGTVDEFEGTVTGRSADEVTVTTSGGQTWNIRSREELPRNVVVMARPERWRFVDPLHPVGPNHLSGVIEASSYLAGSRMQYLVRTTEGLIRVWAPHATEVPPGESATLAQDPSDLFVFGQRP